MKFSSAKLFTRKHKAIAILSAIVIAESIYIGSLAVNRKTEPITENIPTRENVVTTLDKTTQPISQPSVDEFGRLIAPAVGQDLIGTQIPYSVPNVEDELPVVTNAPLPIIPSVIAPIDSGQPLPIMNDSNETKTADDNFDSISADNGLHNSISERGKRISEMQSYADGRIAYIGGDGLAFDHENIADMNENIQIK